MRDFILNKGAQSSSPTRQEAQQDTFIQGDYRQALNDTIDQDVNMLNSSTFDNQFDAFGQGKDRSDSFIVAMDDFIGNDSNEKDIFKM